LVNARTPRTRSIHAIAGWTIKFVVIAIGCSKKIHRVRDSS
jgi:hypothetical protein